MNSLGGRNEAHYANQWASTLAIRWREIASEIDFGQRRTIIDGGQYNKLSTDLLVFGSNW